MKVISWKVVIKCDGMMGCLARECRRLLTEKMGSSAGGFTQKLLGIAVDDHGTPKKIFGLTISIANNPERSLKIIE